MIVKGVRNNKDSKRNIVRINSWRYGVAKENPIDEYYEESNDGGKDEENTTKSVPVVLRRQDTRSIRIISPKPLQARKTKEAPEKTEDVNPTPKVSEAKEVRPMPKVEKETPVQESQKRTIAQTVIPTPVERKENKPQQPAPKKRQRDLNPKSPSKIKTLSRLS